LGKKEAGYKNLPKRDMTIFQSLYEDMQRGEPPGAAQKIIASAAALCGAFRRLPAGEITETEFLQALIPGHFETITEYLAAVDARNPSQTWPHELVTGPILAEAKAAAENHFTVLGHEKAFGPTVDWHHSFGPAGAWPRTRWAEVPFHGAWPGDAAPVRALNRHAFLVSLALAHVAAGDKTYVAGATAARLLGSWCDQNTPETGVNYVCSYEIARRCVSWLAADRLLAGAPGWDEKIRTRLHANLLSQARHIASYLNYSGRAGANARALGETAALGFIALRCPFWQESGAWLQAALKLLWPALDAQVGPDGMHFECAPEQQVQLLEFLALLFTELRRKRLPIPSKCYGIVEKMATALRLLRQPDGTLPAINDAEGSGVVPLPLSPAERLKGLLAVMATFFDRPDFKAAAGHDFGLYGRILLGDAGAEEFRLIAEVPDETGFLAGLHSGGLYRMRHRGDYLLLKNNADPAPRSGANHADLLGLLLHFDGRPVLVDAGTFAYTAENGIRNGLRGTSAHNTLTVNLRGQARPAGVFGWSGALRPGFTQALEEDGYALIDAQHDSYLEDHVSHRRIVLWLKAADTILVADRLQGDHSHAFEQYWHFPPGAQLTAAGPWVFQASDAQGSLAFVRFLHLKETDRHEVLTGSEHEPAMLHSPRYGETVPGLCLKHTWTGTLGPHNTSLRVTVFTKKDRPVAYADDGHDRFHIDGWHVDLTHAPAKVTRIKK
jgi:hypothetical protein